MDKKEMLIKMRKMGVPSDLLVQIQSAGNVCMDQIRNLIYEQMGSTPEAHSMLCSSFGSIGASFIGYVLAMVRDEMQDEAMAKILESVYETKDAFRKLVAEEKNNG